MGIGRNPKNVTNERQIALVPTMIRWWEASRAPEVAKWQDKYRIEWARMDEMEELSVQCGNFCWKLRSSDIMQEK